MNMKTYNQFIGINESNIIDISLFPPDIKKTLDEYDFNQHKFDWNKEQDKHGENFRKWMKDRENVEFSKNINKLIRLTEQDLSTKRRREYSHKLVKEFEQKIKDELTEEQIDQISYDSSFNIAEFEKFVQRNPEYQNLFNEWEKLVMKDTDMLLKDLNALRPLSYKSIEDLNKFLKNLKNSPIIQRVLW